VGIASAMTFAALGLAPSASAKCETAGGQIICGQGDTYGPGRSSVPNLYPCDVDWFCDDDELGVILQPGNDSGLDNEPHERNRPRP
jgi:hypothetical protein